MGAYVLVITSLIHFLNEFILSINTGANKFHLMTNLQLQEKQARSRHIEIYCNSMSRCLATFSNYPNLFHCNWRTFRLDNNRIVLSLPMRFGRLAILLFHNDGKYEHENFRKLTLSLMQLIIDQYQTYSVTNMEQNSIGTNIKINKKEPYKEALTELRTHLNENQKHLNNITQAKGVSNQLTAYPIIDSGHDQSMISANNNYGAVFVYIIAGD